MAQRTNLPDPVWTTAADLCIGCGYSLRGLATPGQCPECGESFGSGQLVLAGIVNRSRRTPIGRQAAWAGVVITGLAISIVWPLLLVFHAVVLLALILAVLGGLIALWVTSPRERRSVERLIIAPAGIARVALRIPTGQNRLDTVFTPWDGANSVELTRISPVWRRLKVRVVEPGGGVARTVFDAGFRCPDAAAADVERAVRDLVQIGLTKRAAPPAATRPTGANPAGESLQQPSIQHPDTPPQRTTQSE